MDYNDETLRHLDDAAVDPFTDMSNPAVDHARHIIAREHGFSSWRKLKEHI